MVWGPLILAPSAAFADLQAVGGSAFGEQTDVLNGTIVSGPLPSVTLPDGGGGPMTHSVASTCVPAVLCSVLRAGPLEVSTQGSLGGSGSVQGSASVVDANIGGGMVTADAIRSQCSGTASGLSGTTTLTNARVGGALVAANPARNLVIYVAGIARVTLNEQIVSANSITVNAIHVQFLGEDVGDVILPEAHCAVTASVPAVVPETPLIILMLVTMIVLMWVVIVAWRSDPSLFSRSAR